jgi:N-methylhydantoinase B
VNINVERTLTPPWGLFGGQCGQPAKAWVKQSPDDPGTWVIKRPNYPLNKNGSVTYFTAGGGGYGPAEERPRELIERDSRLGYASATNG